jgi:hypothetical protein
MSKGEWVLRIEHSKRGSRGLVERRILSWGLVAWSGG